MLYYNPPDNGHEKNDFSEVEYLNKKDEVLSKFRREFIEGFYLYDPALHAIVELLIRGADPYIIIENMIRNKIERDKENQAAYFAANKNSAYC